MRGEPSSHPPALSSQLSTNAATSPTFYGGPYFCDDSYFGGCGTYNSTAAATTAWWNAYQNYWGVNPSNCNLAATPSANGVTTGTFVIIYVFGSACGGGPTGILGTAYSNNPWQNLGDGGNCDGGEGSNGGDSGSGVGGNGASSSSSCPTSNGAPNVGDPINASNGNKYLQDDDFLSTHWLTLRRFYNSSSNVSSTAMGSHWRHSFDRSLLLVNTSATPTSGPLPPNAATLYRPDGKQETFNKTNGVWTSAQGLVDTLMETDNAQGVATGYTVFVGALRHFETYNTAGLLQTVTDESGQGITLVYSTTLTAPAVAPAAGLLLTVTDPEGRQLNFTYNSAGYVSKVALPDGGALTYTYGASNNLLSVEYPDASTRQYVYNESSLTGGTNLPNAMTGIVDEAGVRYESTTYNSGGQATSSSFAGGVGTTQITYNASGTSTVQYPLGESVTLGFTTANGLIRTSSVSQPCGPQCGQPWQSRTYDANGYPATSTDFNNNLTTTQYDANGLLSQEVDASGNTNQRTTNTTWDTVLYNPLTRSVLNASGTTVAEMSWVYNAIGQPLARCEIDPALAGGYACAVSGTPPAGVRRWTYTYCTAVGTQCPLVGLLLTVTGPRTDLTQTTTYSYYITSSASGCGAPGAACYMAGDLHQVTDALGHVTTIASYDADGRITRITDANGVNTDLTYTPRGWLASRTVGGETTSFTYTAYGSVAIVNDPDNVTTTYTYDSAHRLTKVTDALGNYVQYTLDAAGNKTAVKVYDSTGTLHKSLARTFNTLGQVTAVVDGLNNTVVNAGSSGSYDANGNLVQSADALGIQNKLGYDALNRLVSTISDYNGTDSLTPNTTTSKTYDSLNRLVQVTDPSSLNTTYQFDGLSDATGQASPDTGSTTRTFDAAGDVLTRTDAKGTVATSTYDALNRPRSVSYVDTTQNITYSYDEANGTTGCSSSYPIGHLTRIVENAVTTVYCYDARGNVIAKQQITGAASDSTAYTYTAANRLNGITYPSGTKASYAFDGDGRIQTVSLTPAAGGGVTAVSSVSYVPFGPVTSYTLGNGQTITRSYDANYRLTDITSSAFSLHVAHNAMGDVTALGNVPGANPSIETYTYDPLYRLIDVTEAGGTVLQNYTYNGTGDRLSKNGSGLATGTYGYAAGTHHLTAVGSAARVVDADGNTTAITQAGETYGFGYNSRNRMTVAQASGSTVGSYTYNALDQRIGKNAASTQRFGYDEASHLIGEYGTSSRDYVWLGDIPVAVIDTSTSGAPITCFTCVPVGGGPVGKPSSTSAGQGTSTSVVNYVYADGLGTPRAVANSAGTVIWQWAYQGNAFGELQPTSTTGYTLNLRYPGQYYDAETGLIYNGERYFDSSSGRFAQADPAGFRGGIGLYVYGANNPLRYIDPTGLMPPGMPAPIGPFDTSELWSSNAGPFIPVPTYMDIVNQEPNDGENQGSVDALLQVEDQCHDPIAKPGYQVEEHLNVPVEHSNQDGFFPMTDYGTVLDHHVTLDSDNRTWNGTVNIDQTFSIQDPNGNTYNLTTVMRTTVTYNNGQADVNTFIIKP